MGVKTNRNGFLTEDGLVAFYRDFGRLGDDIEAAGVSSTNTTTNTCWTSEVVAVPGRFFAPKGSGSSELLL